MLRRLWVCLLVLGVVCAGFVTPALAGWFVVTLDQPVTDVRVDTPFTVGFKVIEHNRAVTGLSPLIRATSTDGTQLSFTATAEGEPGHYLATLRLPTAGSWVWEIRPFSAGSDGQIMASIEVLPPGQPSTAASAQAQAPLVLRWLGVALLIIAIVLAFGSQLALRRRSRPMPAPESAQAINDVRGG